MADWHKALGAAMQYTDESLQGMGALKGKNCVVSEIKKTDGTTVVTMAWTLDDGTSKTESFEVKDGADAYDIAVEHGYEGTVEEWIMSLKGDKGDRGANGIGITSVVKQGTTGLVDTYVIHFSDGSETTYEVTNGANVTKTSQLTNDSNFIDRLVTNLVNYYTKAEVYTREQIDELMRNVGAGLGIAIVDVLPSTDISTTTIYLVANGESNYIQYMYIADAWANLGSTTVDLTNYYTKEQIDNLFLEYVTSDVFQTALAEYAKIEELGKVAFSNDYNDLENLPEIPSTEGFMKGRQLLGEVDLNECVTEGTFTVTTTSPNLPPIPIYGTYADLEVLAIETVVSQIVRIVVGGEPMMWSRARILGTWTEWVHALASNMATDTIVDSTKVIPSSKAVFDEVKKINDSLVDKANFTKLDANTKTIQELFDAQDNISCGYQSRFSDGVGTDYAYVVIQKTNETYGNVTFHSNNGIYQNRINNGVWSGWKELVTKDYIVAESKSFTLNAKYGTPTQWTCNVAKSGYKVIGVTFEHGYSAQVVMDVETWGNDVLKGYAQLALSASEINITAYAHVIYQKI